MRPGIRALHRCFMLARLPELRRGRGTRRRALCEGAANCRACRTGLHEDMRVLWMTYGAPYPPDSGARMRDFHLIREVARTAEVDLLSLAPPGGPTDLGALSAFCRRVEVFPIPSQSPIENLSRLAGGLCSDVPAAALPNYFPAAAAKVRAMLLANRIELFQVEHSLLAAYGRIGIPTGCRTVLSFHNVGFQQYSGIAAREPAFMARSLFRLKSAAMRRAETHYAAQSDRCVLVSALEKELLIGAAPGVRADVVENGVDCREKQPLPDDGGETVLLFLGVMDYPPNADAAVYFVRSILPRIRARVPDVKFCIAGHSPPARVKALAREPGVEVAGFVNDVTPYYRRAAAVVVPLRAGGLGVMDYPPNADAAVYFVRSILPRIRARVPDVKFCIAGHSPPARVKALARRG